MENNPIIFGPINSRRFGVSLGIDLSPSHKQCNFDCLYCELAPSATVAQQHETLRVQDIINALTPHLNDTIDVITLTANGEPTLYPYLNQLIDALNAIKKETQTLILTNSATLVETQVYHSLLKLDQVKLSLDAVTPSIFKKIDRPHPSIDIEVIIDAVKKFSQEYTGKLFIEILFVRGLNDTDKEIAKLNAVLEHVDATRIDLGTIDRPPAYPVEAISYEELHAIAQKFSPHLPIHIASRNHTPANKHSYTQEEIINTLDKRPLTQEDINLLFDDATLHRFQTLYTQGILRKKSVGNLTFYLPKENTQRKRKKLNVV